MKMYECPECGEIFSSLSWDKSTMEKLNIKSYDDNYGKIDEEREMGCYYICPNCEEEIDGINIKEVF
mgnify:FL=1